MPRLPIFALLLALAAPAAAQEPPPARYAFAPTEAGALRLDVVTGEVSLCVGDGAVPSCTRLSEATHTNAGEIMRLTDRVAALEARLEALEFAGAGALPDDEAMDRVMALTERMMRRFFAMVRDMKRDMEGEEL